MFKAYRKQLLQMTVHLCDNFWISGLLHIALLPVLIKRTTL